MRAAAYALRSPAPRAGGPAATRSPRLSHARPIGNQAMLRRTPCRTDPGCKDIKGDPEKFAAEAEKKEAARAEALKNAPAGSKDERDRGRLGARAIHFEHVLATHGIDYHPELEGFFLNPGLDGVAGGKTDDCKDFPGGNPRGTTAKGVKCVQLPISKEEKAERVDKTGPLTTEETALVAEILRTGAHEKQHVIFDQAQADPARQINPEENEDDPKTQTRQTEEPECDKATVDHLLSEISAAMAEFPVVYKNIAGQPEPGKAVENVERRITFRDGESIHGAITKLKCSCNCQRVDDMVVKTVNFTLADWPADQTEAFLASMTRMLPTDWPKPLQRKE